ncbi:MAG TPA: hypothetical protein VNS60_00515 [Solirubrobacterales bacterium]|nr:hypothetical protein [Solirubrobacterales bacterium]
MNPSPFENEHEEAQEAASILLLRVALALLGEARLRGDFGEEAVLAARAAALTAEFNGSAPSPDPEPSPVTTSLLRPDRISLSAPFSESSSVVESLRLDGILFDGGTVSGVTSEEIEPRELSPEEQADLERRQAEWRAEQKRRQRFTATRFVRSVVAPPQPGSTVPILAVELFEDGFYVEYTYDTEPPTFDPEMTAQQFLALEKDPEVKVKDDLGTEYFESGGGGGGGVRVSHSSRGFAPAPPPDAHVLRITAGGATVELALRP